MGSAASAIVKEASYRIFCRNLAKETEAVREEPDWARVSGIVPVALGDREEVLEVAAASGATQILSARHPG